MKPPMLPPLEKCSPTARTTITRTRSSWSSEHHPQLIALRHRYDVERRPVEDDIRTLVRRIDLDLETVQLREAVIDKFVSSHVFFLVSKGGKSCRI
jgi:hypothetical protein